MSAIFSDIKIYGVTNFVIPVIIGMYVRWKRRLCHFMNLRMLSVGAFS